MPNLNLQGLIDEVLNMVRNRDTSSSGGAAGWHGGNKDEEAYWSDMRKRNTILEQQRLINEGHVGTENVRSAGELARQRLANEGAANTANIGLQGDKFKSAATITASENALKGDSLKAQAASGKADPRALLFETWGKGINPTPEGLAILREGLNTIYQSRNEKTPPKEDIRSFDKPVDKPGAIASPGRESMEFRSGPSPEETSRKKKLSEDRMLYGTKTQARSLFGL